MNYVMAPDYSLLDCWRSGLELCILHLVQVAWVQFPSPTYKQLQWLGPLHPYTSGLGSIPQSDIQTAPVVRTLASCTSGLGSIPHSGVQTFQQ